MRLVLRFKLFHRFLLPLCQILLLDYKESRDQVNSADDDREDEGGFPAELEIQRSANRWSLGNTLVQFTTNVN